MGFWIANVPRSHQKLGGTISKQLAYLDSLYTLVFVSIKISWKLIIYFSIKIKNSDHRGTLCIYFRIFWGCQSWIFSLYIKTVSIFGLSICSCICIDKNILKINNLFFYQNQKFRPQGDPLYTFQNFWGCQS